MTNKRINIKTVKEIKKNLFVFSLMGVQLITFFIFYIVVNFNSILMAFQGLGNDGKLYYTLDNFRYFFELLTEQEGILIALRNTMIFFVFNFIMLPISFTTSYFLYKKVWGYRFFRIIFFFPSIISAVVWSNIYVYIVGPSGPFATILQQIMGLKYPPMLLGDTRYALTFVVLYSFWLGLASNFVLFSGALVRIPDGVIEAGKIDGVGFFGELTKIIVPLVWPTLATMLLLLLTGIFTSSGEILLLTEGRYDTNTISFMIFSYVYNGGNPGTSGLNRYAAAVGLIFTVLTLPIVYIVSKNLNKVEDVQY